MYEAIREVGVMKPGTHAAKVKPVEKSFILVKNHQTFGAFKFDRYLYAVC